MSLDLNEAIEKCKYGLRFSDEELDELQVFLEELENYKQLEKHNQLIKLPCKVGDNIFVITRYGIEEASITGISEADNIDCFCFKIYMDPDYYDIIALTDFKVTWFLAKSEAETKFSELTAER